MIINLRKYFHHIWSNIRYWLLKEDGFSLQGSYISDLYAGLLNYLKDSQAKDLDQEEWKDKLLKDGDVLEIKDYGASSKSLKKHQFRKAKAINRNSTSGRKYKQLYQYFWLQTPRVHVLILGSCKGLITLYVSRTIKEKLFASERQKSLIRKVEQAPEINKTQYGSGRIQEIIPMILQLIPKLDFVLIDVNIDHKATRGYFQALLPYLMEDSVVVIANIHCSRDMEKAWECIRQIESVSLSIDFFECGILIFKKGITKNHFILDV